MTTPRKPGGKRRTHLSKDRRQTKREPFDAEKQAATVKRWVEFYKPTGGKA